MDWETISRLANIVQFLDAGMDFTQTSNDEIMKELMRQNADYLEKIIAQNDKIITLLEGKQNAND